MSGAAQAKVLRLLQDGLVQRLGGGDTIRTDVRVIAATNQDLAERIAGGRFRQDLFYRLNVYTIHLPPLRERLDDLPMLVEYLVRRLNRELGKQVGSVTDEAMRLLEGHDWPGNVRELQATIKSALIDATGGVLTPDCLPASMRGGCAHRPAPQDSTFDLARFVRDLLGCGETEIYQKVNSAVDRIVLEEVLRHVQGNQAQASELLGVARNTLRAKLRAARLAVEKQVIPEPDQAAP